jgi:hypothetical protein
MMMAVSADHQQQLGPPVDHPWLVADHDLGSASSVELPRARQKRGQDACRLHEEAHN